MRTYDERERVAAEVEEKLRPYVGQPMTPELAKQAQDKIKAHLAADLAMEQRGEWITPGAVPGLARAMSEVIAQKMEAPMRAWLTFPGGDRRLIELGPNGAIRTIEDVPAPGRDSTRGKVTVTAKHSIEPYPARHESPAPLTMVIVNERAGQRHETTIFPDGCVDTKVTAYCAGCARGDGVADHTCEAAERARAMVGHRLVMSPEAALTVMRVERDIAREERDAARAELAATKKKLQGVMYGGGKRRRK